MKVSKDEQYQTSNGEPVKIYEIHENQLWAVHGAVLMDGEWVGESWYLDGRNSTPWNGNTLVEVKPKIKVEGWLNVYKDGPRGGNLFRGKEDADEYSSIDRIACLHISQEVEEGEGL